MPMSAESCLKSIQQEFYLTSIEEFFFINVTHVLLLWAFILHNNIKILLVPFVHHIELQNFLNAPRNFLSK